MAPPTPYARRLRRDSTDAERLLWRDLRNRQLAGHKFRRQATVGPYIVDFQCIEAHLVVEADGGQHSEEIDARRTAWLASRGLRIIRFWNHDILTNIEGVIETIRRALEEKSGREEKIPHPDPLP